MRGSKFFSYGPLALLGLTVLCTVDAQGYVSSPPSRQARCKYGSQNDIFCDGVQYEPQSVEASSGGPFHRDVGAAVCNGNGPRFDAINIQNSTLWLKWNIATGQDIDIGWTILAPRRTAGYYYYATKKDWNQSKAARLTKDDFDETPILYIDGYDQIPPLKFTDLILASTLGDRLGYTILLAVWDIADTPNSYYNCIDLNILPKQEITVQGNVRAPARNHGF